jgi:hypothetical protein
MSKSGFEPLTDGFSIQYSTPELLRQNLNVIIKNNICVTSNINKSLTLV